MCWSCVLVRAPPCVFEQYRTTGTGTVYRYRYLVIYYCMSLVF